MKKSDKTKAVILAEAVEYVKSKGFHLMSKEEISKFADCAAEAYESVSYPLINYFVGHPCTKEELRTMWLFNLRYFYSRTLVYSDGPECNGWILWVAPGFKGVSVMNFIRYGGLKMTRSLGLGCLRRIMHYENYSASVRKKATGGREWYLYNLVVSPQSHGLHIASSLVKPMLEFCAEHEKPVYLETHSEKNIAIYRHLGLDVVSDAKLPGTELVHWGLAKPVVALG